jgi:hypothetical protein
MNDTRIFCARLIKYQRKVMMPQLASQFNPADPGPCNDQWPIGDA